MFECVELVAEGAKTLDVVGNDVHESSSLGGGPRKRRGSVNEELVETLIAREAFSSAMQRLLALPVPMLTVGCHQGLSTPGACASGSRLAWTQQ
jgi:hypothetical protein